MNKQEKLAELYSSRTTLDRVAKNYCTTPEERKTLVKGVVDAVKVSIADNGHRQNIQRIEVLGYSVDVEGGKSTSKAIDILADTFNEFFRIPDVQIQANIQLEDRKQGIETLYSKVLPEIRTIIGI